MHPQVPENQLSSQGVAVLHPSRTSDQAQGKMIQLNEGNMCQQDLCSQLLLLVKPAQVQRHQ